MELVYLYLNFMKKDFIQTLKIVIVALILTVGTNYIFAAYVWSPPSMTPPLGNTASPLNVTLTGQIKEGGLTLNNSGSANYGLIVNGSTNGNTILGKVGIGMDGVGPGDQPTRALDVRGDVRLRGHIYDSSVPSGSSGSVGQVLTRGQGGVIWGDAPTGGGGSGITGSGTVNFIPKFLTATSVGNSPIVVDSITGTRVGVGTAATPITAALDVNGSIRVRGGQPGLGKVLTSDATGVGTWQTPAGGGSTSLVTIETVGSDAAGQAALCNLVPNKNYLVIIYGTVKTASNNPDYPVRAIVNGSVATTYIHNHPDGNAPVSLPLKATANANGCLYGTTENFYDYPLGPQVFNMIIIG